MKGMRQEHCDCIIRRPSSKEENTSARLPLRYVQASRRTSLSLDTKGELTILLILYLYNMNINVLSVLRDLLCVLKKTLVFSFAF